MGYTPVTAPMKTLRTPSRTFHTALASIREHAAWSRLVAGGRGSVLGSDSVTWHHTAAILVYVLVSFAVGMWLGSRSKKWDWNDGYRAGRRDGESRHVRDM